MHLTVTLSTAILLLTLAIVGAESVPWNQASLLWGTYRPNLYLGIRPRVPDSLLMGLMWGKQDEVEKNLRHTCEQSDGMSSYGWNTFDARTGGRQTIADRNNHIDITTEFIKVSEGQSSGNWGLRVVGKPREHAPTGLMTSVVFYVGMEAMDACADCILEASVDKTGNGDDMFPETVNFVSKHPRLGAAAIQIPRPSTPVEGKGVHEDTRVASLKISEDRLYQSKSLFLELLKDEKEGRTKTFIEDQPGSGNMHLVQFTFKNSFSFDVLYSSKVATRSMTSSELQRLSTGAFNAFKKSFSSVFALNPPFNTEAYLNFSQAILSNLLGGLGYFHGDMQVDFSHAPVYQETTAKFWEMAEDARKHGKVERKGPYELLTHIPSRSNFPRGFLWDEGFHLLLVMEWDLDLAIEVLRNWLAVMNDDGWIAREQVLGIETRNKVPGEFQIQYPHIANPPTLFWVVSRYIDILQKQKKYYGRSSNFLEQDKSRTLLAEVYPLLKKHYGWFRKSQVGDVEAHSIPSANLDEGYRWRGRHPQYNFPSGLDDYPRAEPPDVSELHVDAISWVGVMAETLEKISLHMENSTDATLFHGQLQAIRQNLDTVHWSRSHSLYCDTAVRDEVHSYTCPRGYISLFPFLLGHLSSTHPHLNATLDLIRNPDHLWTDHGVRSLSPESTRYGMGDNYWRSPIWININYLILEQLLAVASEPTGPSHLYIKQIYNELRHNIITTVYTSYTRTGFVWEQYNPFGHGQRTQHFTGWTALVVKIMAMPELELEEGAAERVREKIKEMVEKARGGSGEFWSGPKGVVILIVAMIFMYVTRRRFAGLVRGLKRSGVGRDRNV